MNEMQEQRVYRSSGADAYSRLPKTNWYVLRLRSHRTGRRWGALISAGTTHQQLCAWLGTETQIVSMSPRVTVNGNKRLPCSPPQYDLGQNGSPGLGLMTDFSTTKAQASSLQPNTEPKA